MSGAQVEMQRRRLLSCLTQRPAHGWVKTVGAGACSQRCFASVVRWGVSHGVAPPWGGEHRFAPPAAPHNPRLHALPAKPSGRRLVCLSAIASRHLACRLDQAT